MQPEIVLQSTADHVTVVTLREELAGLRAELAVRSAAVSRSRGDLKAFEDRYFRKVGVLYAELDALEAQIAEREVDLYDSDAARVRAQQARKRAEESRDAANSDESETGHFEPPASLKTLFRELAKRIHPDTARDSDEAAYFTLLMARANGAYRRSDAGTLQRMLEDHGDDSLFAHADGVAADLAQVTKQVRHARRELAELEAEQQTLIDSEIATLFADSRAAAERGGDLVAELSGSLRQQVAEAQARLALVDKQVAAHGR